MKAHNRGRYRGPRGWDRQDRILNEGIRVYAIQRGSEPGWIRARDMWSTYDRLYTEIDFARPESEQTVVRDAILYGRSGVRYMYAGPIAPHAEAEAMVQQLVQDYAERQALINEQIMYGALGGVSDLQRGLAPDTVQGSASEALTLDSLRRARAVLMAQLPPEDSEETYAARRFLPYPGDADRVRMDLCRLNETEPLKPLTQREAIRNRMVWMADRGKGRAMVRFSKHDDRAEFYSIGYRQTELTNARVLAEVMRPHSVNPHPVPPHPWPGER